MTELPYISVISYSNFCSCDCGNLYSYDFNLIDLLCSQRPDKKCGPSRREIFNTRHHGNGFSFRSSRSNVLSGATCSSSRRARYPVASLAVVLGKPGRTMDPLASVVDVLSLSFGVSGQHAPHASFPDIQSLCYLG